MKDKSKSRRRSLVSMARCMRLLHLAAKTSCTQGQEGGCGRLYAQRATLAAGMPAVSAEFPAAARAQQQAAAIDIYSKHLQPSHWLQMFVAFTPALLFHHPSLLPLLHCPLRPSFQPLLQVAR